MSLFEKRFIKTITEDMTAGDGGAFGGGDSFGHGGALSTSDFYAKGDYRFPKVLGAKKRRKKRKKKKSKKKQTIKDSNKVQTVFTRRFPELLFGPTGIGRKRGYGNI
jgi:hypothetical protein